MTTIENNHENSPFLHNEKFFAQSATETAIFASHEKRSGTSREKA